MSAIMNVKIHYDITVNLYTKTNAEQAAVSHEWVICFYSGVSFENRMENCNNFIFDFT